MFVVLGDGCVRVRAQHCFVVVFVRLYFFISTE